MARKKNKTKQQQSDLTTDPASGDSPGVDGVDGADAPAPRRRRRRRISLTRLAVVAALIAGTVYLAQEFGQRAYREIRRGEAATWFAPYVDVTNTPTYHFEDPLENPAMTVALSFVVADGTDSCTPSWGAYYDMEEAGRALDLDRRVARFNDRDGTVIVSFGGLLNDELAVSCTDPEELRDAYASVIDRYDIDTIDFDIEGEALSDTEANERRAEAVAMLQDDADDPVDVWLTLPIATFGLTSEGVAAVEAMLDGGVDLAGVNAMTMNYGGSREGRSMHSANVDALNALHTQLTKLYVAAGFDAGSDDIWRRIGATPMIGQNDVDGERFTVGDAERLRVFAEENNLGRISMWSLNRDSECGAQLEGVRVAPVCSGIDQKERAFAFEFAVLEANPTDEVEVASLATPIRNREGRDDPARSPYPIWRTSKFYEQGNKVVWHHDVYEAKWWNQGEAPDAPVENPWDTPWRYLGPVLDSERTLVTVPAGVYPAWSSSATYTIGDRVVFEGQAYEARRQSRDQRPIYDPDVPQDTPWVLLDPVSLE